MSINISDLGMNYDPGYVQSCGQISQCVTNVVINTMTPYQAVFYSLAIFFFSIVIHELGHIIALRSFKRYSEVRFGFQDNGWRPFIKTGFENDYEGLTPRQLQIVYAAGFWAGLVVIVLAGIAHQFFFLLLAPYILGSWGDIVKYIEQSKEENNGKQ